MRKINYIVIHESDTPDGRPVTVRDIDSWHRDNGWRRSPAAKKVFNSSLTSIGYQYVIYLDGSVHTGRAESEIPAAVAGHNTDSINICLVGKGRYTHPQWAALGDLVTDLTTRYPGASVWGHYQFDTAMAQGKTCPDFPVEQWLAAGMQPPGGHLLELEPA